MKTAKQFLLFSVLGALLIAPVFPTYAAGDDLEVSGWIPYWRDTQGIRSAKRHLDQLDMVYPFAFTVASDGSIKDNADLRSKEWQNFMKTARRADVDVIPTIMWSDGGATHAVLSNATTRTHHIEVIAMMVERGKYDGVDIDYENKLAETKDYFSLFLKELKAELGNKLLTCTVEARTPPESLYKEVPKNLRYANDYKEMAKHCDQIEIMAYDQQRADLTLNSEKNGAPYFPGIRHRLGAKVVELALEDIPNEKIVLGVPTYGYHYAVTVEPDWFRSYQRIGALNVPQLTDIAKEYKVTPSRNKAGEMSFTYLPKSSDVKLSSKLKIPKDTPKGNVVAARALAHANKTGEAVTFNLGWYPDAQATKDKVDLAKEYDLKGVALFKIDGDEDRKIWDLFE